MLTVEATRSLCEEFNTPPPQLYEELATLEGALEKKTGVAKKLKLTAQDMKGQRSILNFFKK